VTQINIFRSLNVIIQPARPIERFTVPKCFDKANHVAVSKA